ncbi:MAG TPA: hypothetical protein P5186_06560 [Candidatus Paceibacterota bacterium]|nr:hypothetical protein [Verrucomicrobiota bacterium]HRY47691.1 hypothetical protein [Candidatus Paceibacterota bacterium]HSA03739.1 hypothetical protein [Candidatus Paceibacterota bacterium]
MAVLPATRLSPGMEIAADVRNLNGALLISARTILNSQHIALLKMWGVESVTVSDLPRAPGRKEVAVDSAMARRLAEQQIQEKFRHVREESTAVLILKELAIQRLARRMASGELSTVPRITTSCTQRPAAS